jgi:hypothetical protein
MLSDDFRRLTNMSQSDTTTIYVRVPRELHAEVKALAARSHMPMSLAVGALLQQAVSDAGEIPKGTRNVTLTQVAGRVRLFLPYPEARLAVLRAVNDTYCRPPLDDGELEQIARSASGWHGLPWLTSPQDFFDDERLTPNAHLVLRVLCEYADASGSAWPSYRTLSRRTGIKSDTTISKALAELEKAERIWRKRRFNNSNVYIINRSLQRRQPAQAPNPLVLSLQSLEDVPGERRVGA